MIHTPCDRIYGDEQNKIHDGVEKTDGRPITELPANKSFLVYISLNNFRGRNVQRILKQVCLFEPEIEHIADAQYKHNRYGGHNAGQVDMPDPTEFTGAVHDGRFMKLGLIAVRAAR